LFFAESQSAMDWLQHPERRKQQDTFEGKDRRKEYSHGELPPDADIPLPRDTARDQEGIERRRAAERKLSEGADNKPA